MIRSKYIRTKENKIIIFSGALSHSEFQDWNPITAGFISFGIGKDKNPDCTCYGESVTLGIKSDTIRDSLLAKQQILGDY